MHNIHFVGNLLQIISCFLSDRLQCVKFDCSLSSFKSVTSGVPQGSVLGVLLFIIFIIEMEESCLSSILYLYADDSRTTRENLEILEKNLDLCIQWTKGSGLTFNTSKSVSIYDHFPVLTFPDTGMQPSSVVKDSDIYVS